MTSKHAKSDSGYSSIGSMSEKKVDQGKRFILLTVSETINKLKESTEKQSIVLKKFFSTYSSIEIFSIIDEVIIQTYQTGNPQNQGAFLLMIANSITNRDAIIELIDYFIQNTGNNIEMISNLRDLNSGATILHQLANAIVNFHEKGTVTVEDWGAFDYISEQLPELTKVEDLFLSTPADLISQQTHLSIENRECYQLEIPGSFY
jgi:hypothetical protein